MEARVKQLIIMYHEIRRLRNHEGFSIQRIADYYSINFRTAKKLLCMSEEDFDNFLEQKGNRTPLLDPYREFMVKYLNKFQDTPSAVIHDRLKEHFPHFPQVDPKTVYNYVMRLRLEHCLPRITASERQYSAVPDLPPAEQAQVDFGEKKLRSSSGQWVKVYFFTMLLCFSRQKYVLFQDHPFTSHDAVIAHEKSFEFFQGIPRQIIYDQDSVFLSSENLGDYKMSEVFDRYQTSRPFKVVFCRADDPESKGKVENVVKYVKQNFLFHRTFIDIPILNDQAVKWLNRTGNAMVHNTTRKIPQQQWIKEQPHLTKWAPLFPLGKQDGYKVLKTNTVKYRGNIYSVPFGTYKNEQTRVFLQENDHELVMRDHACQVVATHMIPAGVGNNVINSNHRRNTSLRLEGLREKLRMFFSHSPDICEFVESIDRLYPRYVRDQLTSVLSLAESYGEDRAALALEFCRQNSLFSAGDFKSILQCQSQDKPPGLLKAQIKPLGDAKTQLIANMQPQTADIGKYEAIFNQSLFVQ
jgi:hypothetical protein